MIPPVWLRVGFKIFIASTLPYGGRKGSSICSLILRQKKLKNLRPAAFKVMILLLRHRQDNQVDFYTDTKLWSSKVINQKTHFEKRWDSYLYFKRIYLHSIIIVMITLFLISKSLANANKNKLTNIEKFIKEETNK